MKIQTTLLVPRMLVGLWGGDLGFPNEAEAAETRRESPAAGTSPETSRGNPIELPANNLQKQQKKLLTIDATDQAEAKRQTLMFLLLMSLRQDRNPIR